MLEPRRGTTQRSPFSENESVFIALEVMSECKKESVMDLC